MKITKLLPIAIAMTMFVAPAFAEGEQNEATATYTLTLPEYLKITATDPGTEQVTFGDNYTSANINTGLTGVFTVINNNPAKVIYLEGSCATDEGTANALYGGDPSTMKLVFTNQTEGYKAKSAAVSNITGGNAAIADNANAVAFGFTTASSSNDLFPSDGVTSAWDTTNQRAKYTIKNGTSTFTYKISGANEASTFSTHDTMGTYQATLKMTDVTP